MRTAPRTLAATVAALALAATLSACASDPKEVVDDSIMSALNLGQVQTVDAARTMMDAGRYDAAATVLQQIVDKDPQNAEAQVLLGESRLRVGDHSGAMAAFTAALSDTGQTPAAKQGLGLTFLELGDFASATRYLNEALAADPKLWRSHNALGSIADKKADYAAAETHYQAALTSAPNTPAVLNNWGMSHLLQRRYDDAIAKLAEARQVSADPTIATNLRLAYAMKGDYVMALAGAGAREMPDVLNTVGYGAMMSGDFEAAEAYLTRAMTLSPSYNEQAAANLRKLEDMRVLASRRTP